MEVEAAAMVAEAAAAAAEAAGPRYSSVPYIIDRITRARCPRPRSRGPAAGERSRHFRRRSASAIAFGLANKMIPALSTKFSMFYRLRIDGCIFIRELPDIYLYSFNHV